MDAARSAKIHPYTVLLGVLLAVAWVASAGAETLLPLQTQDASTLPAGTAQLILGAGFTDDLRFPPFTPPGVIYGQSLLAAPQLGVCIAAGSWAEIQASYELLYLDERTVEGGRRQFGSGDARLFTKVRVLREKKWRPVIGVRFGTKLPNAHRDDRLGTDETDFGIEALASKDLGLVDAHVNLGILLLGNPGAVLGRPQRDDSGQDDVFSYSLGFVSKSVSTPTPWLDSVRLALELTGQAWSHYHNDRCAVRAGVQTSGGPLRVYGGVSAGLITASENVGGTVGLVYRLDFARFFADD